MREQWKTITGYEGLYEVSNQGNVKRLSRTIERPGHTINIKEKLLVTCVDKNKGYSSVCLINSQKQQKTHRVHRLVAIEFCPGKSTEKNQVNHINSIRHDNRVINLEWCSAKENSHHAWTYGNAVSRNGEEAPASKLTEDEILEIRNRYVKGCRTDGGNAIARDYNVTGSQIHHIVTRKHWNHI